MIALKLGIALLSLVLAALVLVYLVLPRIFPDL